MIRLFDQHSQADVDALRSIVNRTSVQQFMDEVDNLSDQDLRDWIQETGKDGSILYAIIAHQDSSPIGFVYFYPSEKQKYTEISYAKAEGADHELLVSSIQLAMVMAKNQLHRDTLLLAADIDEANVPSIRLITELGFRRTAKNWYERAVS